MVSILFWYRTGVKVALMMRLFDRLFLALADHLERLYYTRWGCRRGRHLMKFSGCMYCGAGNGKVKVYL
jgi:hypothetical protein